MAVNREITTYPHTLTNLLANLKPKQRGVTTYNPSDPNNESVWKQSKGWFGVMDVDGDYQLMAVQKYYDESGSTWIRRSNVFADIEVDQVYTETGFRDQYLAADLPLSESGETALDDTFTATSIVGCLNELKTDISYNPFWKELTSDTVAPRDGDGYDWVYVNSGLKDAYCSGIPLAETGDSALDGSFTATSILGALNELIGGVSSVWSIGSGFIYPTTSTYDVRIGGTTMKSWSASHVALQTGGTGALSASITESEGSDIWLTINAYYSSTGWKRIVEDEAALHRLNNGKFYWYSVESDVADSGIVIENGHPNLRMVLTAYDFAEESAQLGLGTGSPMLNVGSADGDFTGDGIHIKSDIANNRQALLIIEGDSSVTNAASIILADNAHSTEQNMFEITLTDGDTVGHTDLEIKALNYETSEHCTFLELQAKVNGTFGNIILNPDESTIDTIINSANSIAFKVQTYNNSDKVWINPEGEDVDSEILSINKSAWKIDSSADKIYSELLNDGKSGTPPTNFSYLVVNHDTDEISAYTPT